MREKKAAPGKLRLGLLVSAFDNALALGLGSMHKRSFPILFACCNKRAHPVRRFADFGHDSGTFHPIQLFSQGLEKRQERPSHRLDYRCCILPQNHVVLAC